MDETQNDAPFVAFYDMHAVSFVLCTAPLHNVFYQFVKFQVDSFYSLEVMIQTKIQSEN